MRVETVIGAQLFVVINFQVAKIWGEHLSAGQKLSIWDGQ